MNTFKKYEDIIQSQDSLIGEVTSTATNWNSYLDSASRNFKYSFTDQLLINLQKPQATAIANYDFWTKKMGRTVKQSRGNYKAAMQLPVTDAKGNRKLVNYFDVNDTLDSPRAKTIPQWQVTEAKHSDIAERLIDGPGEARDASLTLADAVSERIKQQTTDYLDERAELIEATYQGSQFIENQSREAANAYFEQLVEASVKVVVNKRLGQEPQEQSPEQSIIGRHITTINTPELTLALGQAVSSISETILRDIEVAVKTHDREQERSNREEQNHGRANSNTNEKDSVLPATDRNPARGDDGANETGGHDTRPNQQSMVHTGSGRQEGQTEPVPVSQLFDATAPNGAGLLGTETPELSQGTQQSSVQRAGDNGATRTLQSDRGTSGATLRNDDEASQSRQNEPANGTGQSQRPDSMGSTNEQLEAQDTRNNLQRPDLQLVPNQELTSDAGELFLTPEEQEQVAENLAEQQAFGEKLATYVANPKEYTQPILIGKTPNSLLMLGAKQLDMVIRPSEVDKCMATEVTDTIKHPHSLTLDEMQQIPSLLSNPIMLFEGSHKNSVVAVTDVVDKNNDPIIVAVQFDSKVGFYTFNRVTSMYGKEEALSIDRHPKTNHARGYIQRNIEQGKMLAYNTKKATDLLQTIRLQLPVVEDKVIDLKKAFEISTRTGSNSPLNEKIISFDNSIPYSLKSVKPFEQENLTQNDPVAHLRVENNLEFIKRFQEEMRVFDFSDLEAEQTHSMTEPFYRVRVVVNESDSAYVGQGQVWSNERVSELNETIIQAIAKERGDGETQSHLHGVIYFKEDAGSTDVMSVCDYEYSFDMLKYADSPTPLYDALADDLAFYHQILQEGLVTGEFTYVRNGLTYSHDGEDVMRAIIDELEDAQYAVFTGLSETQKDKLAERNHQAEPISLSEISDEEKIAEQAPIDLGAFSMQKIPPVFITDWKEDSLLIDLSQYDSSDVVAFDPQGVSYKVSNMGGTIITTTTSAIGGYGEVLGDTNIPNYIRDQMRAYNNGELTSDEVREQITTTLGAVKPNEQVITLESFEVDTIAKQAMERSYYVNALANSTLQSVEMELQRAIRDMMTETIMVSNYGDGELPPFVVDRYNAWSNSPILQSQLQAVVLEKTQGLYGEQQTQQEQSIAATTENVTETAPVNVDALRVENNSEFIANFQAEAQAYVDEMEEDEQYPSLEEVYESVVVQDSLGLFKSPWERTMEKLTVDTEGYTEPFVVIDHSESAEFQALERLSFADAEQKFKTVEANVRNQREEPDSGFYYKTRGAIFFKVDPSDTELSSYEFRYDIGDYAPAESGLFNHMANHWPYVEQSRERHPRPGMSDKSVAKAKTILNILAPHSVDAHLHAHFLSIGQEVAPPSTETTHPQAPTIENARNQTYSSDTIVYVAKNDQGMEVGENIHGDKFVKDEQGLFAIAYDPVTPVLIQETQADLLSTGQEVEQVQSPELRLFSRQNKAADLTHDELSQYEDGAIIGYEYSMYFKDQGISEHASVVAVHRNGLGIRTSSPSGVVDEFWQGGKSPLENEHIPKPIRDKLAAVLLAEQNINPSPWSVQAPTWVSSQPTGQEVVPQVATPQKPPAQTPGLKNFNLNSIDYGDITQGGAKSKYARNIEAIKLLQVLEKEDRHPTTQEQETLAKYVGWGGIADAFSPHKQEWRKEYEELKGLLSEGEWEAARGSVLTAYYTDPTIMNAMWDKIAEMGAYTAKPHPGWSVEDSHKQYRNVNILEPSMGVGNFFGAMPYQLRDNANLKGVELDSISGRIARKLYPNAQVQVTGFENTLFDDEYFDVAIGNVPFSESIKPVDWRYEKEKLLIHDYFFNKALDKVKPGGVVAFITSTGTLDKRDDSVRRMLAEKADLLGAVRLPNTAFKQNAGTEVVSDIVFLQKREVPRDLTKDLPSWVQTEDYKYTDRASRPGAYVQEVRINQYFHDNPQMLLGKYEEKSSQYGFKAELVPHEGYTLEQQLAQAMTHFQGVIPVREQNLSEPEPEQDTKTITFNPERGGFFDSENREIVAKDNAYTLANGELYYRDGSYLINQDPDSKRTPTVLRQIGMVSVRNVLRELITAQVDDRPAYEIEQLQAKLNKTYDDFVKEFGLITSSQNAKVFDNDDSYYLLGSLEILDDEMAYVGKSDIFTKRTIKPQVVVTSVDTASEALTVSLGQKVEVDLEYMAELTGFDHDRLVSDLQGVIYYAGSSQRAVTDPNEPTKPLRGEDGAIIYEDVANYETADAYLSGNVRQKLERVKALAETDPRYLVNVKALEDVQPQDLEAHEISVRLGTTWIAPKYVQQFVYELLDTPNLYRGLYKEGDKIHSYRSATSPKSDEKDRIVTRYSPISNEWRITNKDAIKGENIKSQVEYGTGRINAYHLIEKTLNLKDIVIKDKHMVDGKEVETINEAETTLARQKQEELKNAFVDWVFKDQERRTELVSTYNERFNAIRPREYDGSHLTFAGMSTEVTLDKHQIDAVARIVHGGNTLVGHEVGAGKSFTMIAAAMELKRLGLKNKSLIAVPKHLTGQMATEFLRLYPNANILVATDTTFDTKNRKKFCAKVATGNYDAIIMGHTQLEMIPMSDKYQEEFLNDQYRQLMSAIEEAKLAETGHFSVKQMENAKNKVKTKLDGLYKNKKKDQVLTFEELGIDGMFVDEADVFKNLQLHTKMNNVAGISTTASDRAADMFMKTQYLSELTDNKGTFFATGTPISNSLTEMYTMQRYLQYDKLVEMGLEHFDQWASVFTDPTSEMELAPEGTGYRLRTRCAKFQNLPELMNMFKEVADIKTAESLNLPRPEVDYIPIVAKPTALQKEMVQALGERASAIRRGSVDSKKDNMLAITGDGRKLGLDQRVINPNLPDDPESKVNKAVSEVLKTWEETKADKLTQVVFCDMSTPSAKNKKEGGFSVYEDMKQKLIDHGIPKAEIASIHDHSTDKQKQKLFAQIRKGNVRVVFGSTEKMGAGTNIQDKLVELHELDCPWRPRDITQRRGRIIRRGNSNKRVRIKSYVTEGTFDAYLWQTNEKKQAFISQIMTDKTPLRVMEDIDQTVLNFAEVKALCAGDPKIKEKMDLGQDIKRLMTLKSQHQRTVYRLEDAVHKGLPQTITDKERDIENYTKDLVWLKENTAHVDEGEIHPMTIRGRELTTRADAGEAIASQVKTLDKLESRNIGHYRGFDLKLDFNVFSQKHSLTLKGDMNYPIELEAGFSPQGLVTRIDNILDKIPNYIETAKTELENTKHQLETAKVEMLKPFAQEQELKDKMERVTALNTELMVDEQRKGEQTEPNPVAEPEQEPTKEPTPIPNTPSLPSQPSVTASEPPEQVEQAEQANSLESHKTLLIEAGLNWDNARSIIDYVLSNEEDDVTIYDFGKLRDLIRGLDMDMVKPYIRELHGFADDTLQIRVERKVQDLVADVLHDAIEVERVQLAQERSPEPRGQAPTADRTSNKENRTTPKQQLNKTAEPSRPAEPTEPTKQENTKPSKKRNDPSL